MGLDGIIRMGRTLGFAGLVAIAAASPQDTSSKAKEVPVTAVTQATSSSGDEDGPRDGDPVYWPCDESLGETVPPPIQLVPSSNPNEALTIPNDITFHRALQSYLITDDSSDNPDNTQRIFRIGLDGTQLQFYNVVEGNHIRGVAAGYLPSRGSEVIWIIRDNKNIKAYYELEPIREVGGIDFTPTEPMSMISAIAWHPSRNALLVYDKNGGSPPQKILEYEESGTFVGCISLPWGTGKGITVTEDDRVIVSRMNGEPQLVEMELLYHPSSHQLIGYNVLNVHPIIGGSIESTFGITAVLDCNPDTNNPEDLGQNLALVDKYSDGSEVGEIYIIQDGYCCLAPMLESFAECMQGPNLPYESGCEWWDVDPPSPNGPDGDVDLADFATFQTQYQP